MLSSTFFLTFAYEFPVNVLRTVDAVFIMLFYHPDPDWRITCAGVHDWPADWQRLLSIYQC